MPDIALNFTSTNPSLRLVSSFRHTGYVAWPDCFSTFGLLGAVSSGTTAHLACPVPVCVAVQPPAACPRLGFVEIDGLGRAAASNAPTSIVVVFMSGSIWLLPGSLQFIEQLIHVAHDRIAHRPITLIVGDILPIGGLFRATPATRTIVMNIDVSFCSTRGSSIRRRIHPWARPWPRDPKDRFGSTAHQAIRAVVALADRVVTVLSATGV